MLSELYKFLPVAEKVINKKVTVQIANAINICGGNLTATDFSNYLVLPITDNIEAIVDFDVLKKIIKQKPRDIKFISENENFGILFDGKRITVPNKFDIKEFPQIPKGEFKCVGNFTKELISIFKNLLIFVSRDDLKPDLEGIYLKQDKEFSACGTDGHVLKKYFNLENFNLAEDISDFEGILQTKAVFILEKMVKDYFVLSVSDSGEWFKFESDGFVLYSRIIDEQFPNVDPVIPKQRDFWVSVDKKELLKIVDASIDFANKTTYQAEITFNENKMHIHAKNFELNTEFDSNLDKSGKTPENYKIGASLKFLGLVLNSMGTEKIKIGFGNPESAMLFEEVYEDINEDYTKNVILLMPIRLGV